MDQPHPQVGENLGLQLIGIGGGSLEFGGGRGAVRDIVEQVLRSQDEWAKDRVGVLGVASR